MTKQERYIKIFDWFKKNKPIVTTELKYINPYELLVAVILSAQCTDKRVNMTTPAFFDRFPDAPALAKARVEEIYAYIRSITYPNSKSKHLSGMAKMLIEKFDGVVPERLSDLQKLPGVGRKTANVVASVIYGKPTMAVDTHVFRVSARLGLTINAKTPLDTEKQLLKHIPESLVHNAHHWLILHGRYVCTARKPDCTICGLKFYCEYYAKKTGHNLHYS